LSYASRQTDTHRDDMIAILRTPYGSEVTRAALKGVVAKWWLID